MFYLLQQLFKLFYANRLFLARLRGPARHRVKLNSIILCYKRQVKSYLSFDNCRLFYCNRSRKLMFFTQIAPCSHFTRSPIHFRYLWDFTSATIMYYSEIQLLQNRPICISKLRYFRVGGTKRPRRAPVGSECQTRLS